LLRLECDLAAPGLEWLAGWRRPFAWAGVIHLGGTLAAQTLFDVVRCMHRFYPQGRMTVLSADVVRELSAREQAQWTLETVTFVATATLQCQERVARQGIASTCDWETMHFELVLGSGAAREGS
jgi:hypothetical protein